MIDKSGTPVGMSYGVFKWSNRIGGGPLTGTAMNTEGTRFWEREAKLFEGYVKAEELFNI